LKNTPHSASCKRAHDACGTNKLLVSKRGDRAQQQHFDSPHGFFDAARLCACADVQKIFEPMRPKMGMLPYFSGPRAVCRLSRYVNADFLARIFT